MLKIRTDDGFMGVPERFEESLTNFDKGRIADFNNDEIIDVADTPFTFIHTAICESMLIDDYLTSKQETEFLINLGINPLNCEYVDPEAKAKWRKKADFFIDATNNQVIDYPKIPVIVKNDDLYNDDDSPVLQSDIDLAVVFLQDLMTEIATKNKLSPQVLPAQMHVYNDGISNSLSTKPVENGPLNSQIVSDCNQLIRQLSESDSSQNPAITNQSEKIIKKYQILLDGGSEPLSIDITPELFMMIVRVVKLVATNHVSEEMKKELINKVSSAIGFLLAHELGHIIDYSYHGYHYPSSINSQLTEATKEIPELLAYSICLNKQEGLLKTVFPDAIASIKKANHESENEANYLGAVLFLNAGLDPQFATTTFLDEVPESFTHPAEIVSKTVINIFLDFL